MSSKTFNPFKDFQSDQMQRSSLKILTAHSAYRNADLNLTPVTGTNKGRYTRGDMSLQHVAATDHSVCTGRATSCSNKVRRHVAATNRFVCTGEFL